MRSKRLPRIPIKGNIGGRRGFLEFPKGRAHGNRSPDIWPQCINQDTAEPDMFRVNNRFRRIRSKSKLNRPRLVFEIERQLFAVAVMHILNH